MRTTSEMGGGLHVAEQAYARMYGEAELSQGLETDSAEAHRIGAIALSALEHMAQQVRCYGTSAGLALLCGRICARMENSPKQAGEFAVQVGQARTDGSIALLNEVARGRDRERID